MAVLSAAERIGISQQYLADRSRLRDVLSGVLKADIVAAVNAADQWAEDNKASYNSALPLPARTALTAAQKAAILVYVITRRYELGA
jgi:hypothetical protein